MKRLLLLLSCVLLASGARAERHFTKTPPSGGFAPTKVVSYGDHDVIRVHAKVRFSTLIVLPKNEQVLDFICGDKDMWIVNGNQNFASIKPAKIGSETNLNLLTASGNVYSFVLSEVSETQIPADVKIFVVPKEESKIGSVGESPKFVSIQELEDARAKIAKA